MTHQAVKIKLTPEQETLLITLYAKSHPDNPLFFDPAAKEILDKIDYDFARLNMVANRKVAAGFKSVTDFNQPEVVLLCMSGTSAVKAVTERLPRARLLLFSEKGSMIQELLNGMAHALVAASPEPAHLSIKYPETLFFVDGVLGSRPISMCVRKGDPDTLSYLNNWIPYIRDSGFFEEKVDYWFNGMDWRASTD